MNKLEKIKAFICLAGVVFIAGSIVGLAIIQFYPAYLFSFSVIFTVIITLLAIATAILMRSHYQEKQKINKKPSSD